MLKTSESPESLTRHGKGGVGIGIDSRARLDRRELDGIEVDDDEVRDNEVEKKVQKLFKSKNLSKSKKTIESDFLTPGAKLAFTKLRQAFVKALILHHFDSECHIRIKTDASSYAISGVFSQLTLDDLDRWHPVAFFSHKMIPAETRYKRHDGKYLAIIETFKT